MTTPLNHEQSSTAMRLAEQALERGDHPFLGPLLRRKAREAANAEAAKRDAARKRGWAE